MVSPTKSPFIIAAATTADASTIFTEVPPIQFAYGTAPSHQRFPGRVLPATDAVTDAATDAATDERITQSGRSRSLRPQPVLVVPRQGQELTMETGDLSPDDLADLYERSNGLPKKTLLADQRPNTA